MPYSGTGRNPTPWVCKYDKPKQEYVNPPLGGGVTVAQRVCAPQSDKIYNFELLLKNKKSAKIKFLTNPLKGVISKNENK